MLNNESDWPHGGPMASTAHVPEESPERAPAATYEETAQQPRSQGLAGSHFSRIPPELRNEIYDLVVLDDDPINAPWPALTGTCKQIRSESLAIYLGSNDFVATLIDREHSSLPRWLAKFA